MAKKLGPDADTRTALTNAATTLFATKGYDRTSVNALLEFTGLSKGTFYHWFPSKEALLDAVVDTLCDDALEHLENALQAGAQDAASRLNRFLSASRAWRLAHHGVVQETARVLYRDENAMMLRKITARTQARMRPRLSNILRQGVQEGVFDVPDPIETAAILLTMIGAVADTNMQVMLDEPGVPGVVVRVESRINHALWLLERMLGASPGTIEPIGEGVIARMVESILRST